MFYFIDSQSNYETFLKVWEGFSSPIVALDIETAAVPPFSALEPLDGYIRLVQIRFNEMTFIFDLPKLATWDKIKEILEDEKIIKVIHNAYFEYRYFYAVGVNITNLWCTMLAEKVLKNGMKDHGFGLRDVVSERCQFDMKKDQQKSDWSQPLTQEQLDYASIDVLYLEEIYNQQFDEAVKTNLLETIKLENNALPLFSQMTMEGLYCDFELLAFATNKLQLDNAKLLLKIQEVLPPIPLPNSAWGKVRKDGTRKLSKKFAHFVDGVKPVVNPTSDFKIALQRLGVKLPLKSKKNSKGQWVESPSFDKGSRYSVDHPVMEHIIPYATNYSLLTKYLLKMENFKHHKTGRIHPSIDQLKVTGRIGMSNPPIQQFPKGDIRKSFTSACVYKDQDEATQDIMEMLK
jgi:DNA polymerase I-like protein with 3'-5' exonuclease and polymerase domains